MERPLSELEPNLTATKLRFMCPACPKTHYILIAIDPAGRVADEDDVWNSTGTTVDDVSITPSINGTRGGCLFHGHVKKGIVSW